MIWTGVALALTAYGAGSLDEDGSVSVVTGRDGRTPVLVAIERDGLRYEYHAVSGTESLWDATRAAVGQDNLILTRPDAALRLRDLLEEELGVADLEDLRDEQQAAIERLRRLGYL